MLDINTKDSEETMAAVAAILKFVVEVTDSEPLSEDATIGLIHVVDGCRQLLEKAIGDPVILQ